MIILIIHIVVSYDQNISLIFYVKDGSHVRLWHPSCVYITAQRQYTAVQKIVHFPCITSLGKDESFLNYIRGWMRSFKQPSIYGLASRHVQLPPALELNFHLSSFYFLEKCKILTIFILMLHKSASHFYRKTTIGKKTLQTRKTRSFILE